ncbi:hypothetical protein HOA92_05860 [archaeon]|jgi:hypothetical protein|nr:hypothetical protein [archaeon]MBT6762537.1 hypothetical protein [archaeon]
MDDSTEVEEPLSLVLSDDIMSDLATAVFGDWRNWKLEDYVRCYEERYSGMSRTEVFKDKENGGSKFYDAVISRGIVDEVFPSSKRNDWRGMSVDDFKNIYKENYDGMTAKQLKDDLENGGKEFYQAINTRKIQGQIITNTRTKWIGWELDDFKEHYKENYTGMLRMEVRNLDSDGLSFYKIIFRRKLMDEVFPLNPAEMWKNYTDEDLEDYAKKNYAGMKRSHIEKHKDANVRSFFIEVNKRGIKDTVLPNSRKPKRYWEKRENVTNRLSEIIEKIGKVPTTTELIKIDSGLVSGIGKYHGGYPNLCETLGYDYPSDRLPNGYWTKEKTLEVARSLYNEHGRIPEIKKLQEIELSSFPGAASRYFGGLRKLREILSLEQEESAQRKLLESIVGDLSDE